MGQLKTLKTGLQFAVLWIFLHFKWTSSFVPSSPTAAAGAVNNAIHHLTSPTRNRHRRHQQLFRTNSVNGQSSESTNNHDSTGGGILPVPQKAFSQEDTVQKFSRDITKVLKVLRESNDDPEVPRWVRSRRLSMANCWTLEDWKNHSTRRRFLHYARTLPTSRLLIRTAPQLSVFLVWTIVATCLSPRGMLNQAIVPLTPLSLVSTFVGALLTLRSNTGLARLMEGRIAWGNVAWHTRELGQLIATKVYPKDSQLAFLLARHTSIFAFLLKAHLRMKQENVHEIVKTMLPPVDSDYLLRQRKLPAAVMIKLRQGIQQLANSGKLTVAEEIALERSIHKLDESLMTCERICASPIPPLYTSHTSRLLMFYLGFLPLALHQSSLSGVATFLVSFVVGYTMLGLDEISHLLEQPFRLMPLLQLSKISMLDVADNLTCRPASLEESLSQLGADSINVGTGSLAYQAETPEYW